MKISRLLSSAVVIAIGNSNTCTVMGDIKVAGNPNIKIVEVTGGNVIVGKVNNAATATATAPEEIELAADKKHGPPVDKSLPACNFMADGKGNVPKFHVDSSCDRKAHNHHSNRVLRSNRYYAMLQTGINHIPDERTATCPQQVEDWEVNDYGHDTKLLFDNEASSPVVLIWVNKGIEYSAIDSKITPPQNDPKAIVQPGQWASVEGYEGHVYYARELTKDGSLGNILVQHQPGMVAIKNTYGHKLPCEKPKLPDLKHLEQLPPKKQEQIVKQALEKVDPEPKITVKSNRHLEGKVDKRDPEWDRVHAHNTERCNIIYKGFRNSIDGCALHMFYIGMQEPTDGKMQCREEFKFHLGLHPSPEDYMHSWESRSKFEATFVGHSWVARLASNMDIVVDSYTVKPIKITDCPNLKQQIKVGAGAVVNGIGEVQPVTTNTTKAPALNITAAAQANVQSI